jgi:hypothetical protein
MPILEIKELGKYVTFCRKNGIKRFKMGDIEFEIGEKPMSSYKRRKIEKEGGIAPELTKSQYSEEEMLFWSATGIPEEDVGG